MILLESEEKIRRKVQFNFFLGINSRNAGVQNLNQNSGIKFYLVEDNLGLSCNNRGV